VLCECPAYDWIDIDISEWREEKKEKVPYFPDLVAATIRPPFPPPPLTLVDLFEDWLFSRTVLWKVLLSAVVTLMLIILLTSTCISDIGFSHGD
jgi:hypothetical protein